MRNSVVFYIQATVQNETFKNSTHNGIKNTIKDLGTSLKKACKACTLKMWAHNTAESD